MTNLINKSIENIPTLIKNNNNVIPVKLDTESILNVQFGNDDGALFNDYLNKYRSIRSIKASDINTNNLNSLLANHKLLIVSFHMKSDTPWENMNKKFSLKEQDILKTIDEHNNKILVSFTNPYALSQINLKSYNSVVVGFQNNHEFQKIIAQQIFGAKEIKGTLPVSINDTFKEGAGIIEENYTSL